MAFLPAVAVVAVATVALGAQTGCNRGPATDIEVGDCLRVGGPPDRPESTEAACGSAQSNFKVVAIVGSGDQCPVDVDSYYSMSSAFSGSTETVCMDIDWVVGGCMSIDPTNASDPYRVDCHDVSVPNRQKATQILRNAASVDQCVSGMGYAYPERQVTVCVEGVA